jgi:hypothetical protein
LHLNYKFGSMCNTRVISIIRIPSCLSKKDWTDKQAAEQLVTVVERWAGEMIGGQRDGRTVEQSPWGANSPSYSNSPPPPLLLTQNYITVFKTASHWILPLTSWILSTISKPISLRSILILSPYLLLGSSRSLFTPGSPTKMLNVFMTSLTYAFLVI